jgi:hypothetical protein
MIVRMGRLADLRGGRGGQGRRAADGGWYLGVEGFSNLGTSTGVWLSGPGDRRTRKATGAVLSACKGLAKGSPTPETPVTVRRVVPGWAATGKPNALLVPGRLEGRHSLTRRLSRSSSTRPVATRSWKSWNGPARLRRSSIFPRLGKLSRSLTTAPVYAGGASSASRLTAYSRISRPSYAWPVITGRARITAPACSQPIWGSSKPPSLIASAPFAVVSHIGAGSSGQRRC